MSEEQTSEEKSLPPSEKKLREARKKGQIAKSSDAVAASTMILMTIYMVLAWPSIFGHFVSAFDAAGRAAAMGSGYGWNLAIREAVSSMTAILVPIYFIGVLSIVLGAVISNKGLIFAAHPIIPDMKRIHPVSGFKRIFSVRNWVEFLKALVKSLLLLGALGLSAWYGFSAVMRIPHCGAGCVGEAFTTVAAPLVILALLLFFFAAIFDNNIQKWLFSREMKMTHSEFKREQKETHGDPNIRSARSKLRREAVSGGAGRAGALKSRAPTMIICAGTEVAVALRYMQGETPAPVVVGKGTGHRASELIELALNERIRVENDPELAQELLRRAKMDAFIPEALFRPIARLLNRG